MNSLYNGWNINSNPYINRKRNTISTKNMSFNDAYVTLRLFCETLKLNESTRILKTISLEEVQIAEKFNLMDMFWDTLTNELSKVKNVTSLSSKINDYCKFINDVATICKKDQIVLQHDLPIDNNRVLIKYVYNLINIQPSDICNYHSDFIAVLILFSCVLLCERPDPSKLHVCDNKINFNTIFYDNSRSVIENIRHSVAHGNVIIDHNNPTIHMDNVIGNISSDIPINSLINGYISCISDINQLYSNDNTIITLNNLITDIYNNRPITLLFPLALSIIFMIVLVYEMRYDACYSLLNKGNEMLKNKSLPTFDINNYFTIDLNGKIVELKSIRNTIGHESISWDSQNIILPDRYSQQIQLNVSELLTSYRQWMLLLTIPTIRFCTDYIYSSLMDASIREGNIIKPI